MEDEPAQAGVEWHHLPIGRSRTSRSSGRTPGRGCGCTSARAGGSWCTAAPGSDAARLLAELDRPAHDDTLLERRLACLLGGAVGDGFGYPVEFDRLHGIRARYGPEGIREPELRDGKLVVSDDTQMTLFTLEGLARSLTLDSIREAYLDWLGTQDGGIRRRRAGLLARHPALNVQQAPGNTCLSALAAGGRGSIEQPINDSKGCGGVMRVAPVGLFPGRAGSRAGFPAGRRSGGPHPRPPQRLSQRRRDGGHHPAAGGWRGVARGRAGRDSAARSLARP